MASDRFHEPIAHVNIFLGLLCLTTGTSHMWLFKFYVIKSKNSVSQGQAPSGYMCLVDTLLQKVLSENTVKKCGFYTIHKRNC